jgi:hypothetical protein
MLKILNKNTILKPGVLAETIEGERWGSTKYLLKDTSGMNHLVWKDIPYNSPILIIDVNEHITFLFEQRLYYIINCYNDEEGIPYWCQIIHE